MLIITFYFLGFLLLLWILEKIPGVSYVAKPTLDGIVKTTTFLSIHLSLWVLWAFKSFFRAHIIFVQHLFARRSVLNPSEEARKSRKTI